MGGRAGEAGLAIGPLGWGGGRGGTDGCTAEPGGRAGRPSDSGWQVRPPRPVPVNDTTFTSTRLGARSSSVVASNESGYEWSGRERGKGCLSHPLFPLRGNGLGVCLGGDGGVIWPYHGLEKRERAYSGAWGYRSEIKKKKRGTGERVRLEFGSRIPARISQWVSRV